MLGFLMWWSSLTFNNKRQLVGCSLGYTPYVCKLSFIHRLHEAQTGSRSTNGYYVMSSNSNHVALNTIPTVFVDVDLIAWDAQLLSLTSVLLISNGFPLFLLTYVYLVIIVFSEQGWLWMASVWPSDTVPFVVKISHFDNFLYDYWAN
jgi:hypothetical protein